MSSGALANDQIACESKSRGQSDSTLSRFTHFFRNFLVTEKQTPQTFSLLECMVVPKLLASRVEFKVWGEGLGSICGVKN